ncbi:uncharacterized protein [Lolium perenne]|uniref:uncharacterized protein n=1 Tax=Lolium perenne TaxID=4522 RepID=UPI0021F53271|nr:uncharacterized protein LOC127339640 [Lolium perenne]
MVKLARALDFPRSEVYYDVMEKINFKITYTLRAKRVERWIRAVKRDFLDAAEIKVVGLDCEFTDPRKGNQRAAILQLSVAQHTPAYKIIIPSAINLQQILQNPFPKKNTPSLYDLANHYIGTGLEQKKKFNYKKNKPPNTPKELEEKALIFGWSDFPLSHKHKQLQYAALDARLGFELSRGHFRALGYNSQLDRLGLNIYE